MEVETVAPPSSPGDDHQQPSSKKSKRQQLEEDNPDENVNAVKDVDMQEVLGGMAWGTQSFANKL